MGAARRGASVAARRPPRPSVLPLLTGELPKATAKAKCGGTSYAKPYIPAGARLRQGVIQRCCLRGRHDENSSEEKAGQKLSLKDVLPKTVCLDCCAKLNQCSDFFDASAEAQVALHMLFREPKEEVTATSSDQNLEPPQEDYLHSPVQESHALEEENYSDEEAELPSEQDHGNTALTNISSGRPEDDQDTGPGSKRKRRVPIRWALELKSGEEASGVVLQTSSSNSSYLHLETARHSIKAKMEAASEERSSSDIVPNVPDTGQTTSPAEVASSVDTVPLEPQGPNPRKRRDGWELYPWMCTDCSQELPSMQALRTHHQAVHNQAPRFMCAQCSKVYTKYYGCEECGKCFSNKKVLESHRATHSDARPFVCTECGKSFRQQSALYVHNRSHMPESVKNRYPCDQCDKRFSTKPNLVTHKRIHTGIRNFTCDQCGKSFIQKGNLDAHLLTHSVDKPHICPICNKGFKTPLQLRKHQTVHTGAKPHQCDVCGRQFRERGTLREHHRIHTGAMPFTCEFCGKSFRFKGILTTHRRQHTGERPYSCLECQHHFTNWPNYNKHMKRRHGINTSHQPDPNKIALANLASAGNSANVGPTNTTPATTTLLVMRQQQEQHQHPHPQHQSQPQTPGTPAEHCQAILGLASDLLDHPTLPTGAPPVQYNHHPGNFPKLNHEGPNVSIDLKYYSNILFVIGMIIMCILWLKINDHLLNYFETASNVFDIS
ncbi:Gs1-like protein, partial [Gryllus bimaculatus]